GIRDRNVTGVQTCALPILSGALLLGPTPIHNIWSGFNGDCANGDGSDPVVLYDKSAQRWVVGQMNFTLTAYCMAVSTTSDATQRSEERRVGKECRARRVSA